MMRILAFMWHLAHKRILVSGGLRRFIEVVSRGKKYDTCFTVIENRPSLSSSIGQSLDYESVDFQTHLDRYEDILIMRFFLWLYWTVKATLTGIKLTSKQDFDIVMTYSGELFCTAFPPFMIHFIRHVPLVYVVQLAPPGLPSSGFLPEFHKYRRQGLDFLMAAGLSFYGYVGRLGLVRLYNKAELIVTVSESLKTQLSQYGVKKRMRAVRNGINIEEMEEFAYTRPKIYDAVFVGRHTPEKGVFDLIDVWREIVITIPTAVLALIGYCTQEMRNLIERRIRLYDLARNVLMKGVVPQEELVLTMKQSKLFLFLSREESFGLVIGEALACGLPVVCYSIPSVMEFYKTRSVLRCTTGDKDCAAEKTLRLLLDEEFRKQLEDDSRLYIKGFTWDETVEEEFRLFHSFAN